MQPRQVCFLILTISISTASLAFDCHASGPSYVFQGVFAPTNRPANASFAPTTPIELVGKPFTISVTWPENAEAYSTDWQYTNEHWGSYTTQQISIQMDVPGFDFSVAQDAHISEWGTLNDTDLEYAEGVPLMSGDELRLVNTATWARTYAYETTINGITQIEEFTSHTDYIFAFRAIDRGGNHLSDDSLQTNFDLNTFDELLFEFQQVVPVAGGDPRPVYYQHWLGVVTSAVAVPEPSTAAITSMAFLALSLSTRSRRVSAL